MDYRIIIKLMLGISAKIIDIAVTRVLFVMGFFKMATNGNTQSFLVESGKGALLQYHRASFRSNRGV